MDMKPFFTITVSRTAIEDAELGRAYKPTGQKDKDGNDIWGYTESQWGKKEVTRVVFTRIAAAVDLDALTQTVSKVEKIEEARIAAAAGPL